MAKAISRTQLLRELLPGLEKLFGTTYQQYDRKWYEVRATTDPRMERAYYIVKCSYGDDPRVVEERISDNLTKEEADAFIKLLE